MLAIFQADYGTHLISTESKGKKSIKEDQNSQKTSHIHEESHFHSFASFLSLHDLPLEICCSFLELIELFIFFSQAQDQKRQKPLLKILCKRICDEDLHLNIKELWKYQLSLPNVISFQKGEFQKQTDQPTKYQRDIRVDLHRTFSSHSFFQETSK